MDLNITVNTYNNMGRKKLGHVLFGRRVPPSMVPALERVLVGEPSDVKALGGVKLKDLPLVGEGVSADSHKDQIQALLNDVERLEKEKLVLMGKLDSLSRMSDNELVQGWIRKYDLLKASFGPKSQYDQE